jgi:hypothetical protein
VLGVKVGGCGNVNGVDVTIEQITDTCCPPGVKLLRYLSVDLRIDVEDGGQPGITGF